MIVPRLLSFLIWRKFALVCGTPDFERIRTETSLPLGEPLGRATYSYSIGVSQVVADGVVDHRASMDSSSLADDDFNADQIPIAGAQSLPSS